MARRKAKTNVKKATTNVSATAVSTEMTNDNSSAIIKDDPGGGTEDDIQKNHFHSKSLINRTNGLNVNYLKATKDQSLPLSVTLSPVSSNSSFLSSTAVSATSTVTTATTSTSNDSKYLHKKFKKFCATVDSNHSHSHSDINKPATSTSVAALLNNNNNNNNSEIVEDRNSWTSSPQEATSIERNYQQLTVPLQTPKHLQTTEEEKQLVKDIIDINNENFMHHSANFTSSSFLIAQNSTSSANSGVACTVTTLGNHNSNFQPSDIRQKAEPSTFNPASNSNFVIINNHQVDFSPASTAQQQPTSISSTVPTSTASLTSSASSTPGRYICPYCQLNCAKPSVLQKHIRAHTNERPYPCTPCGFAFKTKSNLYKHCRSRAHIQRCSGSETDPSLLVPSNEEDGCSLESGDIDEIEVLSQNENMNHQRLSSPSIVMENQMNGNFGENSSSSSSNSSAAYPVNSSSDTSSIVTKPYKPKFHNYKKLDLSKANALQQCNVIIPISTPSTPLTPSFFNGKAGNLTPQIIEEHISRIISDNEAIIDNVEALLQKKYHKITGIQRNLTMPSNVSTYTSTTTTMTATTIVEQQNSAQPQSNSKLALALLKQQQQQKQHDEEIMRYQLATQPLNLIKMQEPLSVDVSTGVLSVIPRKKFLNEIISAPLVITSSQIPPETISIPPHHHHPEKPSQLVIPVSHPQNPEGSIIKDLLLNSKNFGAIDGDAGDGTYSCPTCKISFRGADILKYHLICHCGDETISSRSAPISPTSQNNNATSPYYPRSSSEKHSPSSLSNIAQSQLTPHMPSSLQKLAKSQLKVPKQKPENIVISPAISAIKIVGGHPVIVKNPLPSPGPLLGNTRLVDKRFEEEFNVKKIKLDYTLASPVSSSTMSSSGSDKKNSPFFDVKFMHDRSTPSKNFPSGGSFTTLESNDMQIDEMSPNNNMMRHGLSGGIMEVPVKRETSCHDLPPITPKLIVTITPTLAHTLTTNTNALFTSKNHFQFPPSVAVYNPLTLPLLSTHQSIGTQSIVHGGRVIPYVPGMPGPNTGMTIVNKNDLPPPPVPIKMDKRLNSPSMKQQNGLILTRDVSPSSTAMPRPNGVLAKKKSFNFARIADNIDATRNRKSPESNDTLEEDLKLAKPAFLRPTSLSLKPGTFTPKQHHGITPTANTLPLISPETPRPSKSCVQLYLNGHAYTYLGLKSSTKPFYCTVNKPQPSYIQNQHKLSMYSNWQIYNGNNPNIFDLSPYAAMSLYDSRQRTSKFSVAEESKELVNLVEMQTTKVTASIAPSNFQIQQVTIKDEQSINNNNATATFENPSEDYTYIRGRGRGKYICQECGIRCKKPSMLKKHIRTHTDLRPYTCSYCEFSFKTKGNLTKHMKSKAHFKKCTELGISPIPTMPDDDINDPDDSNEKHHGGRSLNGSDDTQRDDSDSDDNDSDSGDDDTGDEDTDESKSRMPEHEAAQLLLSLSNHAGTRPSSENSTPIPPQMLQLHQMSQQHQENNWQERVEPPLTPRSRIIFSKSKPADFDFHDMGKYYSDPSLCRPKEYQQPPPPREISVERTEEEEDSMPMDLTKKSQPAVQRPVIVRVSEVITKFSDQSVLLNHLNSNTEKHHQVQSLGMNFTDAIQYSESYLPQEYHMERALNNARFKQIQHSGKIIDYERLQDKQKFSNDENNTTMLIARLPTQQQLLQQVTTTTPIISTTSTIAASSSSSNNNNNKNGMMDALAELAAKSDKLEIKNQGDESSKAINFNAKSVATEYLKLTQQKLIPRSAQDESGDGSDQESQETAPAILTPQTIVVGGDGFHKKIQPNAIFNNDPLLYSQLQDDSGRPMCVVCRKTFQRASQLKIHMNIHFMERKFRCEACSVSFRTQGHLHKHERSASHENKVNMTSTFGVPTVSNPRPFKCKDCKIAFRIHGHLAKHLRSKMHVLKLECLQKLPFGTYAEMERAGFNLTDIDTSDCDNSLMSLRTLAKKLNEKDPSKLGPLPPLSNDDSGDCDESGMNENYDSDSSDQGHFGIIDDGNAQFKRKIDENEFDNIKRIKLVENHANDTQVPSSNVNFTSINDGGEKMACAKN